MPFEPIALAQTAAALRGGTLDPAALVSELCDRIDALDPTLQAFLPEPDRRTRLLADVAALATRLPDVKHRPPLYGVPIGVKDIFRVDGFETRAGAQLPPEA